MEYIKINKNTIWFFVSSLVMFILSYLILEDVLGKNKIVVEIGSFGLFEYFIFVLVLFWACWVIIDYILKFIVGKIEPKAVEGLTAFEYTTKLTKEDIDFLETNFKRKTVKGYANSIIKEDYYLFINRVLDKHMKRLFKGAK
jgi:hypothetical protein